MLIVGFRELRDFYPALISQNLNEQNLGVQTTALTIDAPSPVAGKLDVTPIELARAFENPDFRRRLIRVIKDKGRGYGRIGLPAVLGLERHAEVMADLKRQLGKTVFEISTLPPSVPGRRLFEGLQQAFLQAKGRLILGSKVVDGTIKDGQVTQIRFETVNRRRTIRARHYVLATGGIFGGGIQTDSDGSAGKVWEPIFGLPITADSNRHNWFTERFLAAEGQPVSGYGLQVNQQLNPVNGHQTPLAENLYVTGAIIANANWIAGRTGDGLALATAARVVEQIRKSGS